MRWILVIGLLAMVGCHAQQGLDMFSDPAFQQKLGEQINKVVSQPANPFSWVELAGTLATVVVAATAGSHVVATRAAKKVTATIPPKV
jgi:uncharacterized lipoprotein YmbA